MCCVFLSPFVVLFLCDLFFCCQLYKRLVTIIGEQEEMCIRSAPFFVCLRRLHHPYPHHVPSPFSSHTTACRIDEDTARTLDNVEAAQVQLNTYLDGLSSGTWLLVKIFGLLLVFAIIFVFFVA
jgi:hypothetical protein